jgi:hypothetical protein
MSMEVHIDWQGETRLVGRLHAAERGSSVSFEYDAGWLQREDTFAIDPTSLPLAERNNAARRQRKTWTMGMMSL